jgi:hypothetical protein
LGIVVGGNLKKKKLELGYYESDTDMTRKAAVFADVVI